MEPYLEEAWRMLRLADRDITAYEVLKATPRVHRSVVGFHAQQAVEKSLKAVLYSHQIEFERIHDLARLAQLLPSHGIALPVDEDQLRQLNPYAVTLRYDDLEIEIVAPDNQEELVPKMRQWAEEQVQAAMASDTEEEQDASAGP